MLDFSQFSIDFFIPPTEPETIAIRRLRNSPVTPLLPTVVRTYMNPFETHGHGNPEWR